MLCAGPFQGSTRNNAGLILQEGSNWLQAFPQGINHLRQIWMGTPICQVAGYQRPILSTCGKMYILTDSEPAEPLV